MAEQATAPKTAPRTPAPASGSAAAGGTAEAPAPVVERKPVEPKNGFWWGTGRRKRAVARVRIRPGEGKFQIKGKDFDAFFTQLRDQNDVIAPLKATQTQGKLDVFVNVHGGGYTGQAGAVVLGLARALKDYDPSLEPILREHEFLTRDARKVERKKPGQPGARKRFQFSKR